METVPKDPPKKQKLKKIKELEAKLAKYEAKVEEKPRGNKPYTKEASEEKVGKVLYVASTTTFKQSEESLLE